MDNKNKIADMREIAERMTDIIRNPGNYSATAEDLLRAAELQMSILQLKGTFLDA